MQVTLFLNPYLTMTTTRRIFIKNLGVATAGLSLLPSFNSLGNHLFVPAIALPRSKPEQQGVSPAGILQFLDEVETSKIGFHSVMIIRRGHVVAEGWWSPYAPPLKHTLYSLSKSFTSTAVGFAVSEKRLGVDDPVTSFFKDELPSSVSGNLAAMKVKHLLTMSTGHAKDTMTPIREAKDASWSKTFLEQPVEYEPGTFFLYNTGATYMLSAMVQKLTGQTVMQYLTPRLFEPLGIEGMDWEMNSQGVNVGGYGLRVTTEDIAKFGQLYLQKGMWNGKQIMPASWVEQASSKQVNSNPSGQNYNADNDWAQGYGYQFWRCSVGGYRADGAFGQFGIVLPEYDAVIAATSESFDMGASMKLIWKYVLPAMKQEDASAIDEYAGKKLDERLKSLTLDFDKGTPYSPLAKRISGKLFEVASNDLNVETVSFRFSKDFCTLTVKRDEIIYKFECGLNRWVNQKEMLPILFQVPGRTDITSKISAVATWSDEKTLTITKRYIETAHGDQLTFIFDDDRVTIKFLNSVAKGNPNVPEKRPDLNGRSTT
jgi:CubicO group peptidase (beta-lactamase class C family)